jgi:hypothetical protein
MGKEIEEITEGNFHRKGIDTKIFNMPHFPSSLLNRTFYISAPGKKKDKRQKK